MNSIAKQYAARVNANQPHSGDVLNTIARISAVHDRLVEKRNEIAADRRLSAEGRTGALASAVWDGASKKGLAADLAKAARRARVVPEYVKGERAKLGLPKLPGDSVVEALRRMELRGYVAALPNDAARMAALADPEMRDAIFDGPAALSGFSAATRRHFDNAKQERIREIHAARFSELDGQEADYNCARLFAEQVKTELRQATGLQPLEFEQLIAPLERAEDASAPPQPPSPSSEQLSDHDFALSMGLDFDKLWAEAEAKVMGRAAAAAKTN